ncbi:hypothetical protein HS088_TW10G00503 [Tripterygium wilfordii]|uniref:Uncharacterized protein n=1 Tax=Tripterygium wilfordii TaxID=458696 RepID=A0A7J7D569_TRIWF|nr:hypothetical protein HS088_TW10G00503 [Tripterygium wilfordii]
MGCKGNSLCFKVALAMLLFLSGAFSQARPLYQGVLVAGSQAHELVISGPKYENSQSQETSFGTLFVMLPKGVPLPPSGPSPTID